MKLSVAIAAGLILAFLCVNYGCVSAAVVDRIDRSEIGNIETPANVTQIEGRQAYSDDDDDDDYYEEEEENEDEEEELQESLDGHNASSDSHNEEEDDSEENEEGDDGDDEDERRFMEDKRYLKAVYEIL